MNCKNHVVVALLSLTLIALELAWTRLFSAATRAARSSRDASSAVASGRRASR